MAKDNLPLLLGIGAGVVLVGVAMTKSGGGRKRYVHNDSELARFRQVLPEMQTKLLQLEAACATRGFDLYWGDAFRTDKQVQATVDKGTSAVKTASWHESRRALDAYVVDPNTGIPDKNGKLVNLYRIMHQEWFKLGGMGLAYKPYPNGPLFYLKVTKNGKTSNVWDGGHLEWRGGFTTALAAKQAFIKAGSNMA